VVHHDADIGFIESIDTNKTYNVQFTNSWGSGDTNALNAVDTSNSTTGVAYITSVTEFAQKLDSAIGSQNRLGKSNKQVNTTPDGTSGKAANITGWSVNSSDERNYYIPETNLVDTVVHHDADIGFIENVNINNTYNVKFIKSSGNGNGFEQIVKTDEPALITDMTNRANVTSLTEFAKKLDSAIGS